MVVVSRIVQWVLLFLIRFYQLSISPFLGQRCRFYPSCSEYAKQSIQNHGAIYGLFLTIKRILKCGFWHPGGHDPVP